MTESDLTPYRRALAEARASLAESIAKHDALLAEGNALDALIRQLRSVIFVLSNQLELPHELDELPPPTPRRRSALVKTKKLGA